MKNVRNDYDKRTLNYASNTSPIRITYHLVREILRVYFWKQRITVEYYA